MKLPEEKLVGIIRQVIATNSVPASCDDRIDAFCIGVEVGVRAMSNLVEFAEPDANGNGKAPDPAEPVEAVDTEE